MVEVSKAIGSRAHPGRSPHRANPPRAGRARLTCRLLGLVGALLLLSLPAHAGKAQAEAHYKKGTAFYYLGQFDAAIAEFEAGYTEDPRPGFLYNLAQAHRKAGRPAKALDFYRKYLDLDPRSARRHEVMGRVAELERELAAAEEASPSRATQGPTGPSPPNLLPSKAPPPTSSPGTVPAAALAAGMPSTSKAPAPARKRWRTWVAVAAAGLAAAGGATVGGILGSQGSQGIPLLLPADAR